MKNMKADMGGAATVLGALKLWRYGNYRFTL